MWGIIFVFILNPPPTSILRKMGAKHLSIPELRLASDGVTPWNLENALEKLSGESYLYFNEISITLESDLASSSPANVSLRHRM